MDSDVKHQLTGALAVFVLAAGAVLLSPRGTGGGGSGVRVDALFNKVDGLTIGDDVRIAGVPVGSVASMRLDEKQRAIVTLSLDEGVELPNDSSASIQTDGLFGNKFITMEPGFEDIPFEAGDVITVTQDAVIVSELMDQIISEGYANLESKKRELEKLRNNN